MPGAAGSKAGTLRTRARARGGRSGRGRLPLRSASGDLARVTPPPPARRPAPGTPAAAGAAPAVPTFSPGSGAERLADETRERFLREIVARVPAERAVECFLFPPIRQGGVESGVAVVAVRRERAAEAPAEPTLVDLTPDGDPTEAAALDTVADVPVDAPAATVDMTESPAADAGGTGGLEAPSDAPAAGDPVTVAADAESSDGGTVAEAVALGAGAPDASASDAAAIEALPADEPAVDAMSRADAVAAAPERHTVFVARYRLTVKGPERGRWEVDVREEADAPLVTVEEVVRGVGRRAGDAADPTRLDGATLAALGAPPLPRLPAAPGAPAR